MLKLKICRIRNRYVCVWLINLLAFLPLLVFGGQNFSIDSYGIMLNSKDHIEAFIGSFRWFGALIYRIFTLSGHNPIMNSTLDIVLFIVLVSGVVTVSVVQVIDILEKNDLLTYIIIDLGFMISVVNVWFCNILSFPECIFLTGIGIVLCFGAVIVYINSKNAWHYLVSAVLLVLATGVYQQCISVYTVLVVSVCSIRVLKKKEHTFGELLWHYIKPALLIVVSGGVYLLIGKFVQVICDIESNSRVVFSLNIILENVIYFISNQHSYLKGRGFFTTEILTCCYLLIGGIWFILLLFYWKKTKDTLEVMFIGTVYLLAYIATYLPGILSTSHAARAMFAVFSIFIMFSAGIIALTKNKLIKGKVMLVLLVVFFVNTVRVIDCEMSLKKQNEIDKVWCEQILNEIEIYELQSGVKIEEIMFCHDAEHDMKVTENSYGESAVLAEYSLRSMFRYYGERDFKVTEVSKEEKTEYFGEKDWKSYSMEEQLMFEENTLFLCCY